MKKKINGEFRFLHETCKENYVNSAIMVSLTVVEKFPLTR